MKKCPFCAEAIQDAAIKCRYCGSMLDQRTTGGIIPPDGPTSAPYDDFDDVRDLARRGDRVKAVKLLREKTGWGLKEAMQFVADVPGGKPTPSSYADVVGFLILVGIIIWVGSSLLKWSASPSAIKPSAPAVQTARQAARGGDARDMVARLTAAELIKRLDVTTGKFYIDGPLWETFELDEKEKLVKAMSIYREVEYKGLPQVTLYESRSGTELASYGPLTGVTIRYR